MPAMGPAERNRVGTSGSVIRYLEFASKEWDSISQYVVRPFFEPQTAMAPRKMFETMRRKFFERA